MKKQNKEHQNARFIDKKNENHESDVLCFIFFHVISKISNFNMRTAKHLAKASCTELTLLTCDLNIMDQNYRYRSLHTHWQMCTALNVTPHTF